MANQTVYPYGTGGSLPASIGIINDLKTGGADKALSAEQGVVLNGKIERLVPIDFDGKAYHIGSGVITGTGVWSGSNASHESVELQVKPGQKYRLTANATNTSFYAFFKTFSPQSQGNAPDYSSGYTNRISVNAGTTVYFSIPEDTYFLYICFANQGTDQKPQSLYLFETTVEPIKEQISVLRGEFDEQVDFAQLNVLSNQPTKISIEKEGGRILVSNIVSTTGAYALIALPSSLVDGETYIISFRLNAFFRKASAWYLGFVNSSYQPTSGGIDLYVSDGVIYTYKYTHISGNEYLRLASTSQEAGAFACFTDFSISKNKTSVAQLSTRVLTLESEAGNFTGYSYFGEKIKLNPANKYRVDAFATNAVSGQSAAIYDKYLFIVKDGLTQVILYDMEAKAQVYTWITGFSSPGTWHCNQSSFGNAKYDESDMFPVLYISQRNNAQGRGEIQVYRILPTLTDGEITSFTMVLVQTIFLPAENETNCLGYPNIAIDTERGYMWAYSRYNTSGVQNYGKAMFTRFAIPALYENNNPVTTVTLEDSDIQDSFLDNWKIYDNQGAFIRNGKMYMMRGIPSADHFCECNVIDLYFERTRVSMVDLYPNGFTSEPEGCFYYNGTVFFTVNGTNIYRILFN